MINKKVILICIFIFSIAITAQEKTSLKGFLTEVENLHKVTFTYSDDDLKGVLIKKPKENLSLTETITYLNKVTLFNFNILDTRYITVSYANKKIFACGKVLDANTLDPLYLATVIITNTKKGSSTDNLGEFYFNDVSINATISISYIGYNSIELLVKNLISTPCKEIYLTPISEELSEIIIPNYLTSGLQKNIDGSTVLNTEKFGILPGLTEPDILKTIKVLPGVESVNENISNINVRGGTNDQNLMLWDGIKMYHSGHFFGLISAYNPYLTNKVSVTKNGTSSVFSDGVSSTINMETSNKITNTFSGGAGFNLLSADVFIHVPIKENLELHISARRSFTDILSTPTYTKYFTRSFQDNSISSNSVNNSESNFWFYDYSLKVLYDFNFNHSLRANFIHINNNLNYKEDYLSSNNTSIEENSTLNQENFGSKISWDADWNSTFSTSLSAFFSDYRINSSDYNKDSNQLQTQFNNVLETEIKLITNYTFSKNLVFKNGLDFNEIGVRNTTTVNAPSFLSSIKKVLVKSALFTEIEYHKKNTFARLGFRVNYFSKFNRVIFEPRINIRQKLNAAFSLKLDGEFKNQTIAQKIDFEDNFLGIEKRRWILSDDNNTPIIKSKQASFGVEYSKNKLHVDITGFYKKVDDITAINQGFYNNIQTLNSTGNYQTKGIEFLINKKTNLFSTWLSYTYSINNYSFAIFNPETFPNSLDITHSFNAAFNYHITKNIKISLGSVLRSGRPFTKPVDGNETLQDGNRTIVNYDNPNKERLANFFRLDISGSYNFNFTNHVKSTLRLGFTNSTDRKNIIDSYYVVDNSQPNNVRRVNIYSLAFTPNLSFRINF